MRKIYKIVPVFLIMSILAFSSCTGDDPSLKEYSRDVFAMDTFVTMKAYGQNAEEALEQSEAEIKRLEALFDVTDPESDVSHINKNGGASTQVSDETAELLASALDYCAKTGGALDITVYPIVKEWGFTTGEYKIPDSERLNRLLENTGYKRVQINGGSVFVKRNTELDFGAVAKGYCGDRIAEIMKKNEVESALINLGGNVQAIGAKPDGSPWRVGLRNPENSEETVCTLSVSDCAVVTSGNYERFFVGEDGKKYCHIIDPKTGFPAENGIISASVIGKSGLMCDALSTALLVMGTEAAIDFCRSHSDIEAVLITDEKKMLITEGLDVSDISDDYELCMIKR